MSKHVLIFALLVAVCAVTILPGSDANPAGPNGCTFNAPITAHGGPGGPGGDGGAAVPGTPGGPGGAGGPGSPGLVIHC